MEVELLILYLISQLSLVNQAHILMGQDFLSLCFDLKKIYTENAPVSVNNILEMQVECLLLKVWRTCQCNIFLDTFLLPVNRHRA